MKTNWESDLGIAAANKMQSNDDDTSAIVAVLNEHARKWLSDRFIQVEQYPTWDRTRGGYMRWCITKWVRRQDGVFTDWLFYTGQEWGDESYQPKIYDSYESALIAAVMEAETC